MGGHIPGALVLLLASGCVHLSVAVEGVEADPGQQAEAALRTLGMVLEGSPGEGIAAATVPFVLVVRFENTGSVGVRVRDLTYRVEVSGVEVGGGAMEEALEVPAGEARTVRLRFDARVAGAARAAVASAGRLRFAVFGRARAETSLGSREVTFEASRLEPVMEIRSQ